LFSESDFEELAQRNDIAPHERRDARKWTRVSDYVQDSAAHGGPADWPSPRTLRLAAEREARRRYRRGSLWLPLAAVALIGAFSLWAGGALSGGSAGSAPAGTSVTRGLTFGPCDQGGLTNCVASGDSFYLAGKTVRVANIEAPQIHGAACPAEARLARRSAAELQRILNSGELRLRRTGQDLDSVGLLLRRVTVDGRDVGEAMIASGHARAFGDIGRSWC